MFFNLFHKNHSFIFFNFTLFEAVFTNQNQPISKPPQPIFKNHWFWCCQNHSKLMVQKITGESIFLMHVCFQFFQSSFSFIFYFLYIRQSQRRNIFITFILGAVSFQKLNFINFKEFYFFTDFILFLWYGKKVVKIRLG